MRTPDFVEEMAASIAGTSGDGAITTAARGTRPRLSNAIGNGAARVRYTIEQTSTGKLETGVGTMTAGVLVRTRPQVTWDGTTYMDASKGTVVPLQFGATPAANDVLVRIAATAEMISPAMHGRLKTINGDAWRDFRVSAHINQAGPGTLPSLTANREYYACYRNDIAGTLDGVQVEVGTAINPSTLALALYNMGTDGLPTTKILDFNVIDTSTSGFKTDTATGTWSSGGPIWLTPGWYMVGFIASAATPLRCAAATSGGGWAPTPLGRGSSYGHSDTLWAAGSGIAMPAAPAPTNMLAPDSSGSRCYLGLRVTP